MHQKNNFKNDKRLSIKNSLRNCHSKQMTTKIKMLSLRSHTVLLELELKTLTKELSSSVANMANKSKLLKFRKQRKTLLLILRFKKERFRQLKTPRFKEVMYKCKTLLLINPIMMNSFQAVVMLKKKKKTKMKMTRVHKKYRRGWMQPMI